MITREEAIEIAKLVKSGKTRSYVDAATKLSEFVLYEHETIEDLMKLVNKEK